MITHKKSILDLAKTHQVQLHPQAVKQLIDVVAQINDAAEQMQTLRSIFATFHDECSDDRNITPEKMAKCIANHSSSNSSNSNLGRINYHQVVKLQEIPTLIADETNGGSLQIISLSGVTTSRMQTLRQRHCLALQRCFRSGQYRKNITTVTEGVKPLLAISSLEGISSTQEICVLGLLVKHPTSSKVMLEDTKSSIELDFSTLVAKPVGYITNMSLVVATGFWTGSKLSVKRLAFPPTESRAKTLPSLAGLDTFGLAPPDSQRASMIEKQMLNSVCCILAHVHLDTALCIATLATFFREFESRSIDALTQMTFVLVGDFVSLPSSLGDLGHLGDNDRRKAYASLLDILANTVVQNAPSVAANASFVLVPGPNDPTGITGALPQVPLALELTLSIRAKLKNIVLAPNPCRLRFLTHEMVICRKNFYHDMQSAAWDWPQAPIDVNEESEAPPLTPQTVPVQFELVCKTVADQAHLAPNESNVLWRFDSALRMVPLPHVVVLCDRTEQWHCQYKGTNFLNPGSFTSGGTFLWYTPCDGEFVLNQVF
jgi:DNA polymerase epsilon subunit 2